jgi:pimeloyl-ACP methyl ester carboxylesterase
MEDFSIIPEIFILYKNIKKIMKAELVKTITDDGLILNGLLVESHDNHPAVIFIHGFEGDFYTNKFISVIADTFEEEQLSFLAVQTRGTAARQELLNTDGNWQTNGSHYEKLEEAYLDIDAWVEFLKSLGHTNIILAGHSLGTYKIMRYLSEGKHKSEIKKLILLCPFDKNWLLKNAAFEVNKPIEELISIAVEKVKEGKGDEIAPYGFDDVPHSYTNYLSWYSQDEIGKMFDFHDKDYAYPYLNNISIPVHIIVGANDEFFHPSNPGHPEEALNILLANLKYGTGSLIKGAKHSFRSYEKKLTEEILRFIEK